MDRAILSPPNNPVEQTAGSRSLAAAAHRERYTPRATSTDITRQE